MCQCLKLIKEIENRIVIYIILPVYLYLNYPMRKEKNWLRTLLDAIWKYVLVNLWVYVIVTPYDFLKEKISTITKSIYYFMIPKKYIEEKEPSIILFLVDSWYYSLSKTISIKFWAFFVTGIVIFGGCGVWLEVGKLLVSYWQHPAESLDFQKLNEALLFYITTLLGGICSQVFLDEEIPKHIKSGSWLLIILVYFFTAGVAYIQTLINQPNKIFVFCLILTILSLSIAWLINTFNRSLDEATVNNSSLGGDEGLDFPPIAGSSQPLEKTPLKGNFDGLEY